MHFARLPVPSPRGVYRAWYTSPDGYPCFYAVTSDGRCVDWVVLAPGVAREPAEAALWASLDRLDPTPADTPPRRASRPIQLVP